MMSRGTEEFAPLVSNQEQNGNAEHYYDMEHMSTEEAPKNSNVEHEYSISPGIRFTWLGTYFVFSLMLTMYNKLVLGVFHFSWLLTFLHTSVSGLGTYLMMQLGYFKLSQMGLREHLALIVFSTLFTANIAFSNLSLALVNVAFYQTMRMMCPIFTVSIFHVYYGRTYSTMTYLSLLPLMFGAAMTAAGEMKFSDAGFILTLLGVVLAAVKTVVTNRLMTGSLAISPVELLMRMSPLAAIQALACALTTGEISAFREALAVSQMSPLSIFFSLAGNGVLAFLLNISSFHTNKLAGALTMAVCGNFKQCLTVMLGVLIFDVPVQLLNGAGMVITMLGAIIYSKAELDSNTKKKPPQPPSYELVDQNHPP